MAVATKNSSGTPFPEPALRCPGPHVDILRYDIFLRYLMDELECTNVAPCQLSCEALIDCLARHRELISGPLVWSPRARAYVKFERLAHGQFATLRPSGPTVVQFLGKLLPVYCRLCFLAECHESARAAARALLLRFTGSRASGSEVSEFQIRVLEYVIANLSAVPTSEWGEVCLSSDVSVEIKIAVQLLWSHLVLVYSGNRRLLLCNLELFFTRPQSSLILCPRELRAALFVHGKHDPCSQRKERSRRQRAWHARKCPVLQPESDLGCRGETSAPRVTAANRLYESRVSRLCWLGGLWILDIECNKRTLHWLYKPEPHRA